MTKVRIYRPSKTAMQSGRAKTRHWILEYAPAAPREIEPLMGWTSSRDTRPQVRLRFTTKEAAIAFAEQRGLGYEVLEPHSRRRRAKAYADNFRYRRAI